MSYLSKGRMREIKGLRTSAAVESHEKCIDQKEMREEG